MHYERCRSRAEAIDKGEARVPHTSSTIFEGVIPKSPRFHQRGEGSRVDYVNGNVREIPSTSLRAGSSLRLKNGSGQDDTRSK